MSNIFLDKYEVTEDGRVLNIKTNKQLKYDLSGRYKRVTLCNNGECKRYLVHRLVAEAFIPNPDNKPQVNHKDFNTKNNCVDNLEWVTAKENAQHAYGRKTYPSRVRNEKNKKPVFLYNKHFGLEFDSVSSAAAYLHKVIDSKISTPRKLVPHLIKVAKGERKSLYGYVVKYI